MDDRVEIYSDGACKGNPGPGGWGVLLRYQGRLKELCGGEKETTNNRMELTAAIKGLEALTRPCAVTITTDSRYVQQGVTEWLKGWKRRGWKTAANKPVKNADLWRQLEEAMRPHQVEWRWVKGHAGHTENEKADALANQGIASIFDES